MPSFLSKVFGRKKGDDKESTTPVRRTSDPSLLEGKFEAVPSTLSPSSPQFPEDVHASEKGKDKEGDKGRPFGLLRSKSKPQPSSPTTDAPHLTLRLPGTIGKNGDSLVSTFNPQTDDAEDSSLTRRLTPEETLSLIEACSKAIVDRGGLETLGVMRPHWHSASPQLQRKLISLFILSLAHKGPEATLPSSTSPLAAFNSELEYTRSVHDIAAVFRWALRHLKLNGASFGSSSSPDEWSWYHKFYEAERKTDHDSRVFTSTLVPEIPSTHTTLLLPILDIFSSLAAHAEANGYSGSKLTKYFGFWLLTARRATGTEDWNSFYARWEVSGRMFEHLFLSWLRDENTKRPLPRRLQELVAQYPYTTTPDQTPDGLLTRPRFSTRRHDALFVRVEATYVDADRAPPSRSPVGVFADALGSEPKSDGGDYLSLWNQVKAAAKSDSDDKPLPAILSDDTINLLSLVATDPKEQVLLGIPGASSTLVSPLSPVTEAPLSPIANGNSVPIPTRKPTFPSSTPQSPKDWAEFSSAGFGETTMARDFDFASKLPDKDVEVTEPSVQRSPSKQKQNKTIVAPVEPIPPPSVPEPAPEEPEGPRLTLVTTEVVQLDEAFIDFWRDAVVDPISSDWPTFVVGELRHALTLSTSTPPDDGEEETPGSPINWIIIEEKFRRTTPSPTPAVPHEILATSSGLKAPAAPLKRTSSPRPSLGDKKTSLSTALRRLTHFGTSKDDLTAEDTNSTASGSGKKDSIGGRKKFGKSPKISEMGEAGLSEEPEPQPEVPNKVDEPGKVEKVEEDRKGKGEVVTVAAGAVGGVLLATAAGSNGGGPTKKDKKGDPLPKDDKLQVPHSGGPTAEEGKLEIPVASNLEIPDPTLDILTYEEPSATVPVSLTTQHGAPEVVKEPDLQIEPDTLPPAPESIVSHGETPGPQLAFDSTEAGLHHVPDVEEPQAPGTELAVPLPEPLIEHLEDKVEDPTADFGVDLDPVPIMSNHPVEDQEVEEPKIVPNPASELAAKVEEPEPTVTADVKTEEPTAEDVSVIEVPSTETPTLTSEQEVEPTPAHPIVEDEAAEGSRQIVTEYASPPSPSITPSEELEKEDIASPQLVLDEPQSAGDVPPTPEPEEMAQAPDIVAKDIPTGQSALDVPTEEPASQQPDAESHPPSEDPAKVQEID